MMKGVVLNYERIFESIAEVVDFYVGSDAQVIRAAVALKVKGITLKKCG